MKNENNAIRNWISDDFDKRRISHHKSNKQTSHELQKNLDSSCIHFVHPVQKDSQKQDKLATQNSVSFSYQKTRNPDQNKPVTNRCLDSSSRDMFLWQKFKFQHGVRRPNQTELLSNRTCDCGLKFSNRNLKIRTAIIF